MKRKDRDQEMVVIQHELIYLVLLSLDDWDYWVGLKGFDKVKRYKRNARKVDLSNCLADE